MHVLEAAGRGHAESLEEMLDCNGELASFQDDAGVSALMRAAGAGSLDCVRLLLDRGAPWNALDRQGRCAGEYAVEAGSQACVDALVAAGVQAQLLFGMLEADDDATSDAYLSSRVELKDAGTLVDATGDGVMMGWETPLMEASADVLARSFPHDWCVGERGRVLNVGHGLGIIDEALQCRGFERHTIVEPHPDVLRTMRDKGWHDRADVRECTWQTALDDPSFGPFDAIYFDTYAENYAQMRAFFAALPRLLKKPHGIFSFFNGCCPFNPFFHGVACELIKVELRTLGFDIDFVPIKVDVPDETWAGVRRRYWTFDSYHLPIVRWSSQSPPS